MTKIIIKHNKFLEPIIAPYIASFPKYFNWSMPDELVIKDRVKLFKNAWTPIQNQVIEAIEKYTNGPFRYSIVDVSIVSTFPRTFSNPLIIGVTKSDNSLVSSDEFICKLVHELIHKAARYPIEIYREHYPNETNTTADHIFVHALLKYIYLDVLMRKDLLDLNIMLSKKHSTHDYMRCWEIVEKEGYKNILEIALQEYKK